MSRTSTLAGIVNEKLAEGLTLGAICDLLEAEFGGEYRIVTINGETNIVRDNGSHLVYVWTKPQ